VEYLTRNPNVDELLADNPGYKRDDVKVALRYVQALMREVAGRDQGADRLSMAWTHALPPPDTSITKLDLFRTLISPFKPGRMLDLGTGGGRFALAAARAGWRVTAVDARLSRLPDVEGETDPERAALMRTVRWIEADVRDFAIRDGEYDLICILGLLHHLEVDDQVALLMGCARTLTLLDTRIAPAVVDRSELYEGMYVREPGESREARDLVPTASWGNEVSFRHTEESLLRLIRACGYIKMLQMRPAYRRDYTFYLCLPPTLLRKRSRGGRSTLATRRSE